MGHDEEPKALLSPGEVRTTAVNVRGWVRAMIDEAEAEADSDLPTFAPSRFHLVIW